MKQNNVHVLDANLKLVCENNPCSGHGNYTSKMIRGLAFIGLIYFNNIMLYMSPVSPVFHAVVTVSWSQR